jgi:FKBP-type peptidyl-prolyl cis-trans isomerase
VPSSDQSSRQFAKVGKLGAAILGNVVSSQFQLLVYYTKQKHLLSMTITHDFAYTVQSNLYGSFKDTSGNHWSMLFNSQETADGFARQVALTRCLAAPNDTIITLDLVVPKAAKGRAVQHGDTVGCAYKGYLEEDGKVGRVFDENSGKPKPFRMTIGSSSVIAGWTSVSGMLKGGKRILAIPPSKAYGSTGAPPRIPPNATLIFEIEVLRVKYGSGGGSSNATASAASAGGLPDALFTGGVVVDQQQQPMAQMPASASSSGLPNVPAGKSHLVDRMKRVAEGAGFQQQAAPQLQYQQAQPPMQQQVDISLSLQLSPVSSLFDRVFVHVYTHTYIHTHTLSLSLAGWLAGWTSSFALQTSIDLSWPLSKPPSHWCVFFFPTNCSCFCFLFF